VGSAPKDARLRAVFRGMDEVVRDTIG
jgi:hypothetical protein